MALDAAAYRRELLALIRRLNDIETGANKATLELLERARQSIAEIVAVLGDSPSAPIYERALEGVAQTIDRLRDGWARELTQALQDAFDTGEAIASGPLAAAGVEGAVTIGTLGTTATVATVAGNFSTDLIQEITASLRKRINAEISGVVIGAQTPFDAMKAIGRNLTDRNHFATITARAQAITVTEIGRAQAVATQATQQRLANSGLEIRKRWLSAHLPNARATHLEVEARHAPDGTIGPIPIEAAYSVAGTAALYPRDPSLPASESVHCHCVSISVVPDLENPFQGDDAAAGRTQNPAPTALSSSPAPPSSTPGPAQRLPQ